MIEQRHVSNFFVVMHELCTTRIKFALGPREGIPKGILLTGYFVFFNISCHGHDKCLTMEVEFSIKTIKRVHPTHDYCFSETNKPRSIKSR